MSEHDAELTQKQHTVARGDLPLHCPRAESEEWHMHPRVFLPIEAKGEATCPYCGTRYILKD